VCNTPTTVGRYTSIATGVQFRERIQHPCIANPKLVSTAAPGNLPGYPPVDIVSGITVGNDVWIGEDAVILAPVHVGDGSVVGMLSLVTKDVPAFAIVGGNPARFIRWRFDAKTRIALKKLRWWDWNDEDVDGRKHLMHDIDALIATL
jgi:chloramphenicol O-acetyltransferase type B